MSPLTFAVSLALTALLPVAAAGQVMPLAMQPTPGASSYSLWTWHEDSATVQPGPIDVTFLPIDLGGYAPVDSLRLDRPALVGEGSVSPHVRLPGGGSLYQLTIGVDAALVHVLPDGTLQTLLTVPPDPSGALALLACVHVATDGSAAIVATSLAGGGDVYVLDLQTGAPPTCITTNTAPLSVDDTSLRVSLAGAFFVANGVLYRADLSGAMDAAPVDLQLGQIGGQTAQPELALAAAADRVALVVGDDPSSRNIVVVGKTGPAVVVTDAPDLYDTPHYDHPIGPWLALCDDGSMVAYRCTVASDLELFVRETDLSLPSLHVTVEPDFHDCMDNVGVLGFRPNRQLNFILGDVGMSGVTDLNVIAMGEMFTADFSLPGAASYYNVSLTNGVYQPPYPLPGSLYFTDAYYDPAAQNVILAGPDALGAETLSTFVDDASGSGSTVVSQLTGIEEPPLLMPVGQGVLVVSAPEADTSSIEEDLGLLASSPGGSLDLSALLSVPDGVEIDRFAHDGDDIWSVLVASIGTGLELPVLVDEATGALVLPTWPMLLEVSPSLAFSSSGRMYFGLGAVGGPYIFASWDASQGIQRVPVAKGYGFPLAY